MCQDLRHLEKAEIARRPNGGLGVDDDDDDDDDDVTQRVNKSHMEKDD